MMQLSDAASVLDAHVDGVDVRFTGVSTDTRTLKAGDLFIALHGEHFDGHRFLAQAQAAGASSAMVEEAYANAQPRLPLLVVKDTRRALGGLAAHWRSRFALPLVALTGSNGKTTVKEMLAAILREAVPSGAAEESVLATRGNLNNDIGLPLTLLELKSEHRYAVIEMGMNHTGEISYLAKLARPDVALVNNAGRAHIEFLGSEEAIARAKGEIFEGLGADGTAVINADDRYAPLWRELAAKNRRIEFGLDQPATVTATYRSRALESEIVVKMPRGEAAATLRAPGVHNVRNALAAAAAATALDVPVAAISAGLERFAGIKGRLQMKRGLHGSTLIDDTYNANPESMRAAIEVLAQTAARKLLVLGDMGELGHEAPQLHAELGAIAKKSRIDRMFTLGEHSAETTKAFGAGARHFTRIEDLLAEIENALAPDVTVLVKGSRFMKMERVVNAFVEDEARRGRSEEQAQ